MVFVLGLYGELEKSGSDTPTSEVPLLDSVAAQHLVMGYLYHSDTDDRPQAFDVCFKGSVETDGSGLPNISVKTCGW